MKNISAIYVHEALTKALENTEWVEKVLKPEIGTFGIERLYEAIREMEEEHGLQRW